MWLIPGKTKVQTEIFKGVSLMDILIGVIAGIASTVQASINTEARRFFRSPFITAGLNFIVAWLCLAAFIVFNEHALSVPVHEIAKNPPWSMRNHHSDSEHPVRAETRRRGKCDDTELRADSDRAGYRSLRSVRCR